MPIDYKRYPVNWKEIRAEILERANNKCEECGVQNYQRGARDRSDQWHDEDSIDHLNSDMGYMLFGEYPKIIKIILTISHTDHDIAHNDPSNLRALCQRCHNRWDAEHRKESRRRNKDKGVGQQVMLTEES